MNASEIWNAYTTSPYYAKDTTSRRKEQVKTIYGEFAEYARDSRPTPSLIFDWLRHRTDGLANKTYDEYLRIIRQVLKATMSVNGLSTNPALEVPVKRRHSASRKPYSRQDVEKMLAMVATGKMAVPYRYKTHGRTVVVERTFPIRHPEETATAIMLGAFCGMRLGDALNVSSSDVDGGMLSYTPHKTQTTSGAEVTVPVLDERLASTISRKSGWLTPRLRELHHRNPSAVCRHFRRVFEAAGFQTTTDRGIGRMASTGGFHALRHSYVTWGAEAGVPIDVMAACVGHASVITTKIYNHISNERKAHALAAMMKKI